MRNANLIVHGVLSLDNDIIKKDEKLVLTQFFIAKSLGITAINSEVSAAQLGYKRQGWNKINKRLMEKGFTKQVKRGWYSLTDLNIY